jgi:hypothetical protein
MSMCRVIARLVLCAVALLAGGVLRADDPLRAVIDQRLILVSGFVPAQCSDTEFLRRASLDLIGMPPTADDARSFLNDAAPNKREQLVDRLLASPHYARHLASTLDLMLMERRANTHVTADEWQAWLLKSVRENKPWNVLAKEILIADGDDPALRPAARFALDRASEPNLLTHDISRIFFGRDMQCAQCHDHPLVMDYLQSDYQGLLAFLSPGYALVRKEGDKSITLYAERAGGDLPFESVFIKGTPHRTGARMPEDIVLDEPLFLPGDEYQVAPADNVKSVPKFSRRAKLAELATSGNNPAFNQNIANRLWAHMFGRGLVHPLDLHHADNPATDPELLQILSNRFVVMNFSIRDFLRELALSNAYQRPFDAPEDLLATATQVTAQATELQQQHPALAQAAKDAAEQYSAATDTWYAAEAAALPVAAEVDATRNAYAEAKKTADEVRKALADVTAQQASKQKAAMTLQEAATATQNAAASLPDDKTLAETATLLTTRSEQVAAEATALTPMIDEKTAAVKPLADAQEAAKAPFDAAIAKITPFKVTQTQAEREMLATRRKSAEHSQQLAAVDERLKTIEQFAQLPGQQQAIAVASSAVSNGENAMLALQQQVTEYVPVVAQAQANVKTTTDAMTAATNAMNLATTEQNRRSELASAITATLGSAEAAHQKAGEDALLAEVVAKLKERSTVAQASVREHQTVVNAVTTALSVATEAMTAAQKSMIDAAAERARREQAMAAGSNAVVSAKADLATQRAAYSSRLADIEDRLVQNFSTSSLKPLTPEQLCWSVFRVTGVYERYWQAEVAELDKTTPLTDEQKQDAAVVAARNVELEQRTFDKLKGNIGTFVTFYGAAAGQPQGDFFSTADQALFAGNGGSINSWVVPAADNVTDRVIRQTDSRLAAEEIYLSVLTRLPTKDEVADVTAYLANRAADRNVAAQELVWAVLNSAEFRFSH